MKKTFVATTLALAATTACAQAGAPIKIGVVTPLSGTYAGIGQQVKWGLDLAAAQINAGGGVMGRKLELIYEDEEANPAVATQKAEKLFQVNKVDFLTGTVNSGSTLAVGQVVADDVGDGHADLVKADLAMTDRLVVAPENRQHPHNLDPFRIDRDQHNRVALVTRRIGKRDTHKNQHPTAGMPES